MVPGAGLEPATFGCLRHSKQAVALMTSFDKNHIFTKNYPMSPTRYQLRHPGSKSVERQLPFEYNRRTNEVFRELVSSVPLMRSSSSDERGRR